MSASGAVRRIANGGYTAGFPDLDRRSCRLGVHRNAVEQGPRGLPQRPAEVEADVDRSVTVREVERGEPERDEEQKQRVAHAAQGVSETFCGNSLVALDGASFRRPSRCRTVRASHPVRFAARSSTHPCAHGPIERVQAAPLPPHQPYDP